MTTPVLEHHVFNIRKQFPESGVEPDKAKRIAKQHTKKLSRLFTKDGKPVYPGLREPQTRKNFAQAKTQLILEVKSGNHRIIPDIDEDGTHNFDSLCQLCGNQVDGKCQKPNPPYIQSRV